MNCADIRERLDTWVAGRLAPDHRDEVDRHLETCAECRADADAARFLRPAVAELPRAIAPPPGLWGGIERRIAPPRWRPGLGVRRALAVAATVALMAGSSAVTVMFMRQDDGRGLLAAPGAAGGTLRVFEVGYVAQARSLATLIARERDRLAPETVAVLEQNLRIIDEAIQDSRAALAADPANPELETLLRTGHQQKLALLEQGARLAREL